MKKKLLGLLAVFSCGLPLLAAEGDSNFINTGVVTDLLTDAKTSLTQFVTDAAPIIGGIAGAFLVLVLIFLGIKLIKRASKQG